MAMSADGDWAPGRYPRMVAWIRAMHAGGATICSACSGGMLTAETGLLDGEEATIHWLSEKYFRRRHPGWCSGWTRRSSCRATGADW